MGGQPLSPPPLPGARSPPSFCRWRWGFHSKCPPGGNPGGIPAHWPLPEGADEGWVRARGHQCRWTAVGQLGLGEAGGGGGTPRLCAQQLAPSQGPTEAVLGQWGGRGRGELHEWLAASPPCGLGYIAAPWLIHSSVSSSGPGQWFSTSFLEAEMFPQQNLVEKLTFFFFFC